MAAADIMEPALRETRAVAYFQTGKLEAALKDFNILTKDGAVERQPTILQYLTLTLARLGRSDEARASLAAYLLSNAPASTKPYMQILVPAWLGDMPEALRHLESAIKDASSDQDQLYNAACAAALCAQATAEKDSGQSQRFRNQALDLLQKLVDNGYRKADVLSQDPDFAILHGDPRFVSILSAIKTPGAFWAADREVTRGQFEAFINDATYAAAEKPAEWKGVESNYSPTADHPAQNVGWYDAVLYCNWLSLREGRTVSYKRTGTKEKGGYDDKEHDAWRVVPGATGYRLLREAEWESACRAGTTTEFSSGDDEGLLVAYCQMYPSKLTAVCGVKLPNASGVHDAHGNVWEWCEDHQVGRGSSRVYRGGCWGYDAALCRTAIRYTDVPTFRSNIIGFRLVPCQSSKLG